MFYTKIHGHFNFEFLYSEMVDKFSTGSNFVEIGAYLGRSTCFLAEKIRESGKDITINVIDNWVGHPSDTGLTKEIKELGDIYKIFTTNMTAAGVIADLNIIRGDSAEAALGFENKSVDFIFVDAAHDYDSVIRDLNAWLPKMKSTGIMAGHDYGNPETQVKEAVDKLFGNKITVVQNTWICSMKGLHD